MCSTPVEYECANCANPMSRSPGPWMCGYCQEATDGSAQNFWPAPKDMGTCDHCGDRLLDYHEDVYCEVVEEVDEEGNVVGNMTICIPCWRGDRAPAKSK